MRSLGIDYGDSKVGFAITDELGITVQGLYTVHYKGNDKLLLKEIDVIFNKYNIDLIVIGMPFNMDGSKGNRAELTQKFIHKLKCKYSKVKIDIMDERMTSIQANRTLNELNINKKKKKDIEDTLSAVYILQTYRDINKNK